ncbi:MAG: TetR/AcrR family transcriptional regulator [Alphaproteobacteria bacterium]|nr:TetR/AcrR family transcriptional regulator [Alphaproteobacteria bacterium]
MTGKKTKLSKSNSEQRIRARNEAKILKSAVELFSRKGFDGTRIAEIAEASGLPKANVYYYFANKAAIYTRLIEGVLTGWDRALEHITPDREPREALSLYIAAKLDYSRKHASESRFFANEMLRGGKFLSRQQKRHMKEITREYARVIEGWMEEGKIVRVDPNHFLIMLWATTQFYADFSTVAAATVEKKHLTASDFETARSTIVDIILNNCVPPR